jgi:hypothetical protein
MKCPDCGVEISDDSKFCKECGHRFPAGAPRAARKASVSFGDGNMVVGDVRISAERGGDGNADFGAAASVSIGNENDIAGDVHITSIGKQENIHVAGGGTFVKDESKTLVMCHVCRGNRAVSDTHDCSRCHKITCKDCYDRNLNWCETCKEDEYKAAFRAARENGTKALSPEQIGKIETRFRIRPDRAAELHAEVIRNEPDCRHDDYPNIDVNLFAKGNVRDAYAMLQRIAKADPYKYDAGVMARRLYAALKIASRQKDGDLVSVLKTALKLRGGATQPDFSAESAAGVANQIVELAFMPGNDMLGVYLVLIDQALEGRPFPENVRETLEKTFGAKATKDLFEFARMLLDRAEVLWRGSVLLKCREIIYLTKLYEQTRVTKCRTDAEKLLKSLPEDSPSVMERSWIVKVRGAMQAEQFDPTPQLCEDSELYFFVLNPWNSESFCKLADSLFSNRKRMESEPFLKTDYFNLIKAAATDFPAPSYRILKKLGDCYAVGFGTQQSVMTALALSRKADASRGIQVEFDGTVFKSYQDKDCGATEYAVPDGITEIASGAFAKTGLRKIAVPTTVETIRSGAFRKNGALQTVELSEGLRTIQSKAFEDCCNLKSIAIPSTVKTIRSGTFLQCRALESVILSEGLETIEKGAFDGCDALRTITIPESVSALEADFGPSCVALFAGDRPLKASSFEFDGTSFSVPGIVGIRSVLHSFSQAVTDAAGIRAAWCHPSILPDGCNRDCKSCLLSSKHGCASRKILAFLAFCRTRNPGVRLPEFPKYGDLVLALAETHLSGGEGMKPDPDKAAAWFRNAAESKCATYGECLTRIRRSLISSSVNHEKNGSAFVRVLENLFSDSRICSELTVPDWLSLLRSTSGFSFTGIRFCPWNRFGADNWTDLLSTNPEFAGYCGLTAASGKEHWKKLSLDQWRALAKAHPETFMPALELRSGGNFIPYLKTHPWTMKLCNWGAVSPEKWVELLKDEAVVRLLPKGILDLCPWGRFSPAQWTELLIGDTLKDVLTPEILARCRWNEFKGHDWVELLRHRPEYADRCAWGSLGNEHCASLSGNAADRIRHYVDVNALPLSVVVKMGWEKYRDWSRVATGKEWVRILKEHPALDRFCNWNLLDGKDWVELLSGRPEFKDKCRWNKLDRDDWKTLADEQPDLASFFPWNLRNVLNYPNYYYQEMCLERIFSDDGTTRRNAICISLARKFSFFAFCAFMLVFTVISLWGKTGWFALLSESGNHAMKAGAIWLASAVLCAILYARIWGGCLLSRWVNLGHAGFVAFSFFAVYRWSFFFSRFSGGLVLCGALSFLLLIFPVVGRFLDDFNLDFSFEDFSFFTIPYFSVFSWFLLSPVEWSGWLTFFVILLFVILFVAGKLSHNAVDTSMMNDLDLIEVLLWLVPSLIIGVWFLLMPVDSKACYEISRDLQGGSFGSARNAYYIKALEGDRDYYFNKNR